MSSLDDVRQEVGAALADLPTEALLQAGKWIDERAGPILGAIGSNHAELTNAVAALGFAREAIDQVFQLYERATSDLDGYLAEHAGGTVPVPAATTPPPARIETREQQVVRIRAELPPPVGSARTLGRWIDEHGREHELRSGEDDEWFEHAATFARKQRMVPPGRGKPLLARHVEIKFAMRMRAQGLKRATIVIDRAPCGRVNPDPLTCHAKLGEFLPPGAELTIIDREGNVYTYRGKDTR